jgi:hypothetical protein
MSMHNAAAVIAGDEMMINKQLLDISRLSQRFPCD